MPVRAATDKVQPDKTQKAIDLVKKSVVPAAKA
jgi:hypothetical protein